MKLLKNNKHSWYSVIVSLLIIWFLLVLSIGVFRLVLNEMNDNKAMWDYIKAYAWAESSRELALLQIKENWYAYYDKVNHDINNRSIILANNPLNTSVFKPNNDVFISYDIWSMTSEYNWNLGPLEYDIIPLFYIDSDWEQKVTNIDLSVLFWTNSELSWNIIWKDKWISWNGSSDIWYMKTLTSDWFNFSEKTINNFLLWSDTNYLVLLNSGSSSDIEYKVKANIDWESFSKPKTSIISSAEIGKYKQNISTNLDNTEFLNILKYSIYSN